MLCSSLSPSGETQSAGKIQSSTIARLDRKTKTNATAGIPRKFTQTPSVIMGKTKRSNIVPLVGYEENSAGFSSRSKENDM